MQSTIGISMSNIRRRPDALILLISLVYGTALTILMVASYSFPAYFLPRKIFFIFATPGFVYVPVALFWTIYQCVRYERHPWKYIIASLFVPMGFLWYIFERYRSVVRSGSG
jgi:hypothetical protein